MECVLDRSFGSLLLSYWARRLWLKKDNLQEAMGRLEALKGFLDTIWNKTQYGRIFYETMVLFKDLPELAHFFDEGGLKMKSFVDTMPEPTRKIYEEVLVVPVVRRLTQEHGEKLKQVEMEREKTEAKLEKTEAELEKTEAELIIEREKAEKEIRATCQQVIFNKFPDVSGGVLVAVNQLSFSQCNQLLRGLEKIRDVQECEAFLKNL